MTYAFIDRACSDLPVAVCCRVMKVSTSGFYAWRTNPIADRDLDDTRPSHDVVRLQFVEEQHLHRGDLDKFLREHLGSLKAK